ncbi:MAG: CBS domain-containing protein [Candidatus Tectomicrobia bacterium]|uniref:CBS domain-containing protein n=1 Tax=Tectimicrobiota bacterium TaxID=2528274 RepID=A0A932CQM5_UNCTE|nr:CBS domain-containing protein [Candidatus Tectomicrobia bacterium]
MTQQVITVSPGESIRSAVEKLREYHIRQLPVVEGNEVIGIITDRDLRQASSLSRLLVEDGPQREELESFLDRRTVEEVMSHKVVTVAPTDTIEDVARILHDYKIGGVPVVEGRELVGIITGSDILEAFLEVMGIGVPSSRLEVVLEDRPGQLAQLTAIIKEFHINIVSLVTLPQEEPGQRTIILRLNTIYPNPIIEALQQAGFQVVSPC